MKLFKYFILSVIVLVLLVIIISLFLPDKYEVVRTRTIHAPIHRVYPLISDFHQWSKWSPWEKMDPNATMKFSEPSQGVGAWQTWQGDTIGTGKMTFTQIIPYQKIKYHLQFVEPFESESDGWFLLNGDSSSTTVSWHDNGKAHSIMERYMFLAMDKIIGSDFERGLHNIDSIATKYLFSR